jgi:hypothetical protein
MSSFMGSRKKDGSKNKNHAQDCRTLIGAGDQRPAILPWFLDFGWRPSFRVIRAPCPLRPAAGLLLDWSVGTNAKPQIRSSTIMPGCESLLARTRHAREPRSKTLKQALSFETTCKNARRWRAQ